MSHLNGEELFYSCVHLQGEPARVRRFLPDLIDVISNRTIDPGKVFYLTLPLEQAAEGYRAMDHEGPTRFGASSSPATCSPAALNVEPSVCR